MTQRTKIVYAIPVIRAPRNPHGFSYPEAVAVIQASERGKGLALPAINEVLTRQGKPLARNASSKLRQLKSYVQIAVLRRDPEALEAFEAFDLDTSNFAADVNNMMVKLEGADSRQK